jgi:hypothetical protein
MIKIFIKANTENLQRLFSWPKGGGGTGRSMELRSVLDIPWIMQNVGLINIRSRVKIKRLDGI